MIISFNVDLCNIIPIVLTLFILGAAVYYFEKPDSSSSYSCFIPDVFTPMFNVFISLIALLVISVIWILFLILKVNGII